MRFPIATGEAAHLLHLREPQLNDLIRRGRIPTPRNVVGGRRQWTASDVESAAEALDVALPDGWQGGGKHESDEARRAGSTVEEGAR